MPGLSFLSKKSWHTSNVKNVEKVWIAEQKSEQESKRMAELQRQLQEERQIQELRQLQAASGQVVRTIDNSMDWMYEGPASEARVKEANEEYLLGKVYKPQQPKTFELGVPVDLQPSKSSQAWVGKVANKNDIFSRKHEDPMIMIKQAEKKQLDNVLRNPIKMERIRQSIAKELEEDEHDKEMKRKSKKELKRIHKEAKKTKKESKRRSHLDSEDSRSSSDEGEDKKDQRRPVERSRSRDRPAQRGDSRSRSPDDRHHYDRDNRDRRESKLMSRGEDDRNAPRRRDDNYDRRRDKDYGHRDRDYDQRSSRRDSRDRDYDRNRPSSSRRSPSPVRSSRQTNDYNSSGDQRRNHTSEQYGLQSSQGKRSDSPAKDYFGPRPELLRKKEEADRKAKEERQQAMRKANVRELSEEERLRRLREMESDAGNLDQSRVVRVKAEKDDQKVDHGNSGNADFIRSMRSDVIEKAAEKGIKDRIEQHRHYNQRSGDMEENFLRR